MVLTKIGSTRSISSVWRWGWTGLKIQLHPKLEKGWLRGQKRKIFWRSKKQSHVALSTAEAEFIALSLACREITSVKEMMKRLLQINTTPTLFEDNKAAIKLAKSDDSNTLKHIVKLCYHYVRFEAIKRNVEICWVPTEKQLADGFTKALSLDKFKSFQKTLLNNKPS